jgi:hypothetical protein
LSSIKSCFSVGLWGGDLSWHGDALGATRLCGTLVGLADFLKAPAAMGGSKHNVVGDQATAATGP